MSLLRFFMFPPSLCCDSLNVLSSFGHVYMILNICIQTKVRAFLSCFDIQFSALDFHIRYFYISHTKHTVLCLIKWHCHSYRALKRNYALKDLLHNTLHKCLTDLFPWTPNPWESSVPLVLTYWALHTAWHVVYWLHHWNSNNWQSLSVRSSVQPGTITWTERWLHD